MKFEQYNTSDEALKALTNHLVGLINKKKEGVFNLALSGGETAKKMFALWTGEYKEIIDWNNVRFYWVDERCVPKYDEESNFGNANRLFFYPLNISKEHYHCIKGENYPPAEAEQYSKLVEEKLPKYNKLPRFDCIILGVGSDMHTASIFPDCMELLTDEHPYATSRHPQTGQHRVTMTGPFILNNTPLLIPILGKNKQSVIENLKAGDRVESPTPASYILGKATDATIYVAEE